MNTRKKQTLIKSLKWRDNIPAADNRQGAEMKTLRMRISVWEQPEMLFW